MKIVVHVGLPKTASRSLQTAYFPAVAAENFGFAWAGALQPSRRRPTGLFRALREAVTEDGRHLRLKETLAGGSADTVIFSDPGILREPPGSRLSWKTKIARLGRALEGTDHTVVLTLRDPMDAAFSYFADQFHALPRRKRNFFSQAGTEPFEVFLYARLFTVLGRHLDPNRITVAGFDDIVAGRLGTMDVALGVPPRERAMPHLNRRCRLDGAIRTDRLSLEETLEYGLPSLRLAQSITERLPASLRRSRCGPRLVVPYPTPAEIARLAEFYAPHVEFIRERYGIVTRPSLIAADRNRPPVEASGAERTTRHLGALEFQAVNPS